ncbi:MAG: S9 family peptidase [Bacteroidota bacterium]
MNKLFHVFFNLLIFFAPTVYAVAQEQRDDSLTVEKALSVYRLSSPVFSPDGNKAAFIVTQPATADKSPVSHIWLFDLKDSSTRQYTNSAKSESDPKWAPKGKKLAFLSSRDGERQVYILDNDGGEAIQLTSSKTGVTEFEWSPDGRTIAYAEQDSITAEEKKRKDDKYDEVVMSSYNKSSVLFSIDIATKATHRLPGKDWEVLTFKWMPAGDALVLEVQELPVKEIPQLHIVKYRLQDSSFTDIPSLNNPAWGDIEIAPGGKLFSFIGPRVDGPVPHDIYLQSFNGPKATNITASSLDLPVHSIKFVSDKLLTAVVQRGFHSSLYKISITGEANDFNIGQNVFSYDISADNKVLFVSGTSSKLQELWLHTPGRQAVQLTHFNKAFDKIPLVAPELLSYKSFDGTLIETLLFKPPHSKQQALLPMVVIIHGGPTGAFADTYNAWTQLFLQKGYAVMMPNIRGSTGYGFKFLESNRNDWGGGDFKDIMAGIDYLTANKNIDSNRLAIAGWSYGGYMSEWAITQTNRFKSAMSGAGLFNLASEFGTESNAAYDSWFFGTPYENQENFNRHSAISYIKNAHTPTLIIQGKEDDVDPIGQSQELYRALRFYNVPAELVLYPREHHGFVELKHNSDYISRMLAWIEKYCPVAK